MTGKIREGEKRIITSVMNNTFTRKQFLLKAKKQKK